MTEKDLSIPVFQTFYVSKENSMSPLLVELIRFGKKLKDYSLTKENKISLSISFGKRLLINSENADVLNLFSEDIVEVVDYDPIKKIVLAMGKFEPCIDTPVHWIVQNAREDIHAIVQFSSKKQIKNFPCTDSEKSVGTLDLAKEILKTLRTSKCINIKNYGLIFVGFNYKEIEENIAKYFKRVNK